MNAKIAAAQGGHNGRKNDIGEGRKERKNGTMGAIGVPTGRRVGWGWGGLRMKRKGVVRGKYNEKKM